MKIVKYVFLLLILAAIACTVFIATQSGKYDIKKERVIKVPKSVLYNYINDYRNWENIGILTNNDTTAVYSFSENTTGAGAIANWTLSGSNGQLQTLRAVTNDSIIQKAEIDNRVSDIEWVFKDTTGGTKVSVRVRGKLTFTDKAYNLFKGGSEEKLKSALEKGLENLRVFLLHELNTFDIEIKGLVTKTGTFYLGHRANTTISGISKKVSETFPKLLSFVKTNNIAGNGAPFILYSTFNTQKDSASYMICVPIKEEIITAHGSEFEGGRLESFTALKTTLKGDYSHLEKAWDAAFRHIDDKSLQENTTGQYVEVYTKGLQQTKKPSAWITDIYIPIGAPSATTEIPAAAPATLPAKTPPASAGNRPRPENANTRPAATTNVTRAGNSANNKPAAGARTSATATRTNGTRDTSAPANNTRPATPAAGTTREE